MVVVADDFVHVDIVWFGWNGWEYLEWESQSDEGAMKMGQKAVVVTFSTTEAVPLGSEGHARNDGKVNVGIVGEKGTEGFLNAKGCADSEFLLALIAMQFQFFSYNGG